MAWAQGSNSPDALGSSSGPALVAAQRELAESLVAHREATSGRRLDPAYREWLVARVSALSPERLQELQSAGDDAPLITNALGDSGADLVYTPVTPCRVFDTRSSAAGILAADSQRNFLVSGSASLAGQGGSATGCGIPLGPATSVIINFAAVTPTGAGNLRAWAVATPQPVAPLAAVMNFSTAMFALANGVAVPICNPAATTCPSDLRLQADVSSVHVVGDVVGYFKAAVRPTTITLSDSQGSTTSTTFTTIASMWAGMNNGTKNLLSLGYTKARLVARFDNSAQTPACSVGPMTIRLTAPNLAPNPLVLATITDESCGDRAWYLVSAAFDIPNTSAYDVQVMVASGTGTWRWIGLEVW